MLSRSEGNPRAPIVIVIDAYAHWDAIYERPLTGANWNDKLKPWLRDAGLSREDCFITCAWDMGQPEPHIDRIPEHEMRAAWDRLHDRLAAHEGPDGGGPVVIVPLGDYGLYATTGNGPVSFHQRDGKWRRPGITEFRGSILQYEDKKVRKIKVIPSIHPGRTFYKEPWLEKPARADWLRIAGDARFRELRLPQRTRMVAQTKTEAIDWLRWTRAEAEKRKGGKPCFERIAMSLDVETPKRTEYEFRQKESIAATAKCATCGHTRRWHGMSEEEEQKALILDLVTPAKEKPEPSSGSCTKKALKKAGGRQCTCGAFQAPMGKPRKVKISEEAYLACIGYSWDPASALCIPTTDAYWHDPAIHAEVRAEMAAFHADPNIDFFGQNFSFDAWWCQFEKMPITNIRWDLMKMHRVRCPADEKHNLAYQASLYTREPYWKDEAKDPDSLQRYNYGEALFLYNCTDNCVQRELLPLHITALREGGRYAYYEELEAPMDAGLVELSFHGIRVDREGRAEEFTRVMAEAKTLSAELNEAAGLPIVKVNKAGTIIGKVPSTTKLKEFLYEVLRLPTQYTKNQKKEKVVSTNVVTVKRLMERFPGCEALQKAGPFILRLRRLNTIANFVKDTTVDADGKIRGLFKQDTLLGRLSCAKLPNYKGRNVQNIDRTLRRLYLADKEEAV